MNKEFYKGLIWSKDADSFMHQYNDFATSYNGKDQGQISYVRVEAVSKNIGNVV